MPFDYLDEPAPTAPPTSKFEYLDEGKSVGGFMGNVGKGLAMLPVNAVVGPAMAAKQVFYDLPKNVHKNVAMMGHELAQGTPGNIPKQWEAGPVAKEVQGLAHEIAKSPTDYLYNKPVDAAMLAATPFMMGGGIGKMAGKVLPESTLPYLQQFARTQKIKDLGTIAPQVKQLGLEEIPKIADYAFEKGIGGPLTGSIGKMKRIAELEKQVGGEIQNIRETAPERGVWYNVPDLVSQIKAKLDPVFKTGARASERGAYKNALAELEKMGLEGTQQTTPIKVAETATELWKQSKNLQSLNKPAGAMADVANELSRINNQNIEQSYMIRQPEMAQRYRNLREEYQKIKPLKSFGERGEVREYTSRGGPAGMGMAAIRKLADVAGHKLAASGAYNLHKVLTKPGLEQSMAPIAGGAAIGGQADESQQVADYLRRKFGGQ